MRQIGAHPRSSRKLLDILLLDSLLSDSLLLNTDGYWRASIQRQMERGKNESDSRTLFRDDTRKNVNKRFVPKKKKVVSLFVSKKPQTN